MGLEDASSHRQCIFLLIEGGGGGYRAPHWTNKEIHNVEWAHEGNLWNISGFSIVLQEI